MFSHVMLGTNDLEASKKFYDAVLGALGLGPGVANGGTTCEDPPGFRESGAVKLYMAYLRGPDGNTLRAMYRPAE